MSRYDALTECLRSSEDDVVVLTFGQLDDLVGGLPPSARKHAPWWGNAKKATGQSRYWMQADRQARPDMTNGTVAFRWTGADGHAAPRVRRQPAAAPENPVIRTTRPAALMPSGDHVRTTIAYEWQQAGSATVAKGKLGLHVLPPRPGVYRFVISRSGGSSSVYVGVTDNLFKRMGHHRDPGPSQPTDQRLNTLLMAVLDDGGTVEVDVVTAGLLGGDALDLATRAGRCLVESTALCELGRLGPEVENL